MKVRLIARTEGVAEAKTGQELISYVARVSNPGNQANFETAPKLLKYLIKNNHWSPFEHAYMTVEVVTTRGIAAQILRHRSFVFQEFSQRYAQALRFEEYPARRQDTKNRQNSVDDLSEETCKWFSWAQNKVWDLCYGLYEIALSKGIAKEQARFLLPLNTETTMYISGSVRSFLHYIDLRKSNGTQREHQLIALGIKELFQQEFPDVHEAMWGEHEPKEDR